MNRLRGDAALGNTGKTLRFDANALCEAEEATGLKLPQLVVEIGVSPSIGVIRAMLWAGLRHAEPEIDLRTAGDLISDIGVKAVSDAIGTALTAALGSAEGKAGAGAKAPPKSKPGTGSGS